MRDMETFDPVFFQPSLEAFREGMRRNEVMGQRGFPDDTRLYPFPMGERRAAEVHVCQDNEDRAASAKGLAQIGMTPVGGIIDISEVDLMARRQADAPADAFVHVGEQSVLGFLKNAFPIRV